MLEYQKEQLKVAMRELSEYPNHTRKKDELFSSEQMSKSDSEDTIESYTRKAIIEELEKKLMNIRTIGASKQS